METARQSFRKIMHYQQPERVFNWNWWFGLYGGEDSRGTQFWQQTIDRWHTEGLSPETNTPERVNNFFQVDRCLRVGLRIGVFPGFESTVVEESDEFRITVDGNGALIRQFKGDRLESSMPEYVQRPISCRDDWNHYAKSRLDPDTPGREVFTVGLDGKTLIQSWPGAPNFEEARNLLLRSELPVEVNVGSQYGLIRNLMGVQEMSYALYDDEAWIGEMMTRLADLSLSVISRVLGALDVPIDHASWWEDMAYNQGPLIAPKHIRRLMVPNYRRVNDELHRHGIDVIGVDSDGNVDKIIPHWLDAGINCVYPNEVAAGNDVVAMREKYGRDLLLIGGIDKRPLHEGQDAIRQELEKRLPLVARGGYLPAVDHSVPPDISFENYMYYQDLQTQWSARYLGEWSN